MDYLNKVKFAEKILEDATLGELYGEIDSLIDSVL